MDLEQVKKYLPVVSSSESIKTLRFKNDPTTMQTLEKVTVK